MTKDISKQVQQLMENLISTVELAEEAPDFVANAVQDLFDDYADERLEAAATAVENMEGGPAAVRVRELMKNPVKRHITEALEKHFSLRPK